MRFVLDTSALISGVDFIDGEFFTTQSALREAKRKGMTTHLISLLNVKIKVQSPGAKSVKDVVMRSRKTGDVERLSPTDVDIIALAKELQATILTDDYSIQNLAKEMGLSYHGILLKEIEEKIYWTYRCRGCGKYFKEPYKQCPVCGSALKTTRRR